MSDGCRDLGESVRPPTFSTFLDNRTLDLYSHKDAVLMNEILRRDDLRQKDQENI